MGKAAYYLPATAELSLEKGQDGLFVGYVVESPWRLPEIDIDWRNQVLSDDDSWRHEGCGVARLDTMPGNRMVPTGAERIVYNPTNPDNETCRIVNHSDVGGVVLLTLQPGEIVQFRNTKKVESLQGKWVQFADKPYRVATVEINTHFLREVAAAQDRPAGKAPAGAKAGKK